MKEEVVGKSRGKSAWEKFYPWTRGKNFPTIFPPIFPREFPPGIFDFPHKWKASFLGAQMFLFLLTMAAAACLPFAIAVHAGAGTHPVGKRAKLQQLLRRASLQAKQAFGDVRVCFWKWIYRFQLIGHN
jgi:hypothetical protein